MNIKKTNPPNPESQSETEPRREKTSSPAAEAEAPHKPFQAAYDEYFQKLCKVSEEAQSRILDAQFEYRRAIQRAWESQDQTALQEANDNYQQALEAAANDQTPLQRCADAYDEYKSNVQKAFANVAGAEMDSLTLSAIAQSISIVAQHASQLPRAR